MSCNTCTSSNQLTTLAEKSEFASQFDSKELITWCNGCGNFGVLNALKRALTLENLGIQDVLLCFDIGCNGNGADKLSAYTLHGLHGRVLSAAAGAVLANPKMKVIAIAGDGATFSEGVNHLVHAIRSNYPMLFIIHNNENYGLTIGQASATTRKGEKMSGSPDGSPAEPLNAMEMILGLRPTFAARCFSGMVGHMTDVFQAGLRHNGFACVEVMQVCPTYNKATPQGWYWDRLKRVDEMPSYDRHDLWAARKIAEDLDNEIAIGILYEDKNSQNFYERLPSRKGISTVPVEEVKHYDVNTLLHQFE